MAVSTRTRFEVLKRDGFRCRYCGGEPYSAPLHVDHVVPRSRGGTDELSNLVTACAACNLGKSDVPLDEVRSSPETASEIREHAQQIAGYLQAVEERERAREELRQSLIGVWCRAAGTDPVVDGMPKEVFDRLPSMIERHGFERVAEALTIAARRDMTSNASLRYTYGILRKMAREGG